MLRLLPRVSSLMISNLPVDSPAFLKNLSRVFPELVVANTGSCVRPQSKIGHPACRYRQLIQFSVLGFRGICHHHHHLSLNREGRWGTTDDFKTSFLRFSLFSTALWDLLNSRPVHSLILSSSSSVCPVFFTLSLCLARWFWPDLMNGKQDHCSLRLFTIVRRS